MQETEIKIKQILMEADRSSGRRAVREWILRALSSLVVLAAFAGGGCYQKSLSGSSQLNNAPNHVTIDGPSLRE